MFYSSMLSHRNVASFQVSLPFDLYMMIFGIETTAFSDSSACCVCKYCDQSRYVSLTDKM